MIDVEITTGPRVSTFAVEQGAVLNIIPLTPGATPRQGMLVASGGTTTHKQMEPGHYLFQVDLPSGESVSEEVELSVKQSQPIRVELFSKQSPHEWLSWQQLNADLTHDAQSSPVRGILASYPQPVRGDSDVGGLSLATIQMSIDLDRGTTAQFAPVLEFINTGTVPKDLPDAVLDQNLINHDEQFSLYGWFQNDHSYRQAPQFGTRIDRYFALVEHETGLRELAILPIPWSQDDSQCGIELLVSRFPDLQGPRARLTVQDSRLGAMLTYLSRDALANAQLFVDSILHDQNWMEILYFKKSNPLAAAGAGYVLMQTFSDFDHDQPWYEWLDNLCNWFPWLPDGAVLMALLRMAHRKRSGTSAEVIDHIDQAMSRGIPYYRQGVRHLYNLVCMFAESESQDKEVRERMTGYQQILVPLMQAANPTEPFVSFRSLAYRKV